jgi:prepilin-type N-terminal cleavage/methylation domain-containing protein/prepilin-type processing-associated H-X9-DG protein
MTRKHDLVRAGSSCFDLSSDRQPVRRGFTLIELLVVISIIALLISILLPALSGAKGAAESVRCLSNQRQVGMAFFMYAQDQDREVIPHFYDYDLGYRWIGTLTYYNSYMPYNNPALRCPSQPSAADPTFSAEWNAYGMFDYAGQRAYFGATPDYEFLTNYFDASLYYKEFTQISEMSDPVNTPLLVDSGNRYTTSGTPSGLQGQWYYVGGTSGQVLHLRHSNAANSVMGDGSARTENAAFYFNIYPCWTLTGQFELIWQLP